MKRIVFRVCLALFTFTISVGVASLYYLDIPSHRASAIVPIPTSLETIIPQFSQTGSMFESDGQTYWYKLPGNTDPQAVVLFNDIRSREISRHLFESNTTAGRLLGRGEELNSLGKQFHERAVSTFVNSDGSEGPVRVFWIESDVFWCVQAPTLELALKFEKSHWVQSAEKLQKELH